MVLACSSGTLTIVRPRRNAMPQIQDMLHILMNDLLNITLCMEDYSIKTPTQALPTAVILSHLDMK